MINVSSVAGRIAALGSGRLQHDQVGRGRVLRVAAPGGGAASSVRVTCIEPGLRRHRAPGPQREPDRASSGSRRCCEADRQGARGRSTSPTRSSTRSRSPAHVSINEMPGAAERPGTLSRGGPDASLLGAPVDRYTNVRDNVQAAWAQRRRRDGTTSARTASEGASRGMGLSLRDLAERSGVSAPMLSQVERGETSPTLADGRADRRRASISPSRSCFASTRAATWS